MTDHITPKSVVIDPWDATQALLGASTIYNIHSRMRCRGRTCVIHHPTRHHMSDWTLTFRKTGNVPYFERVCEHGVAHPDPDQMEYWVENDISSLAIHGCDGCCRAPAAEPDSNDDDDWTKLP